MTSIVTEGNVTADAELRFTPNGKAVTNATIAVNDRTRTQDGEWVDGAASFYEITVWGTPAESFATSATKGTRLVVAGELAVEEYTDREGQTRTRRRITAEHVGISVRFTTATSHKRPATNASAR